MPDYIPVWSTLYSPEYLVSDNPGCLMSIVSTVSVKVSQGIAVYTNSLFCFIFRGTMADGFR